ncbi:MAG: hypothetical protein RQ754_10100 [Desulfuromonadales bacterium]|nr:hypothetical protein [Desulfuromonadales bacterium]
MSKTLLNALLLLLALVFAGVSLVGCGSSGSSSSKDPGDFLYATDADETIDIVFDTDYLAVDNWGSGAVLDNAFAGDADYNPSFAVDNTTAPAWGGLGALAFTGFNAGYFNAYTALHLKFKADTDTAVNIKFPGATIQEEIVYNVASATDLGNGWYDFTIRLANHGDLAATTEFAILASGDFYVTDIYFNNDVLAAPAAGDIDGDNRFYLKSGDGNRQTDLIFGVDYALVTGNGIINWDSGSTNLDAVDSDFGAVIEMTPGWGTWGAISAALAFVEFNPGFASAYNNLHFKFKGPTYAEIAVKFPGTTTEEIAYPISGATALGNDWYEFVIPLSGHGDDFSTVTEFGILKWGVTEADVYSVTDVYFD